MGLTDRITLAIEVHREGEILDGGDEALYALAASIPVAGGALSSILSGRALRQMKERMTDVFEALKERIEQMDGTKIDHAFFESDEFLTLFTLTLEQVQTTHDKTKLKMLAAGLANSANTDFGSEKRKELFVRIMRDLAPEHVAVLNELRPGPGANFPPKADIPFADRAAIVQHLVSRGLLDEFLEVEPLPSSISFSHPEDSFNTIRKVLGKPPTKYHELSSFGAQFLRYFDAEKSGA